MKAKTRTRRRKLPITTPLSNGKAVNGVVGSSSAKPRSSARVIRRFHVLIKRKTQIQKKLKDKGRSNDREHDDANECLLEEQEIREIEDEIEKLGGLEVYQRMSSIGQGKDRGGGSERVFIAWLKELGFTSRDEVVGKGKGKLRLLEVGALKPDNYASCDSWIEVLPIDLRSSHPLIVEQDFMKMALGENREGWDGISLSLVVNFVPEGRERGRMLRLAYEMLREDGLLFLVLPLPCISNSRYLTFDHLTRLMEHIGFSKLRERWKEDGKMGYWLFKKRRGRERGGLGGDEDVRFDKKVVLREGKRNNFCILL